MARDGSIFDFCLVDQSLDMILERHMSVVESFFCCREGLELSARGLVIQA